MLATLVLKNGRIYTQERGGPIVAAIAIKDDDILATGDDNSMEELLGSGGRIIDLGGRCLTPGLVDGHVHFRSYALGLQRVDLDGAQSLDDTLHRIDEFVRDTGSDGWLLGRGWNQADWPSRNFPTKGPLDHFIPHRPVFLEHRSGHAAWMNSMALREAGIDATTVDPPGGQILRDELGNATGILLEKAIEIVRRVIPQPSNDELVKAIEVAQKLCFKYGLTGIHDFDGRSCFVALQTMHQARNLRLRVAKNIPLKLMHHAIDLGLRSGFGDERLRLGGVKMFADGALGPRTASMINPYENEPENYGIVVMEQEDMMSEAIAASNNGLSVTIHAIGDRANHNVLDVIEALRRDENSDRIQQTPPASKLRHRIEHAQLLLPEDMPRFASLNVVASMQPIHATSDKEMADRYWGDRSKYSYAWQSLVDNGANVVFGSDAPVDSIEPLKGIFAAVNRRRAVKSRSEESWYPEQGLLLQEALNGYTMGAAYASNQENSTGSIRPGKFADFTIFDRDLFQIDPLELREVAIAGTMIGGELVYRKW